MMTKRENQQIEMHLITIEDLVPMEHLLRKVNDIIDFSFIYNEVENMYCHNNGHPSIDPVALIKFLLIGFLYGINSERRISEEIQLNMAYRWFLGLDIMVRFQTILQFPRTGAAVSTAVIFFGISFRKLFSYA